MKKLISILLALAIFTLSSCSEIEIVELSDRLIIEAIGIDFEDGSYKVTIEGLDSFSAGSDSDSISAPSLTKCYLFEGETIGMAMNRISVITGQLPLFSQARILILGFSTAQERLSEVLDFFRREYTTRTDILFAVAKNTASEVVSADFGKNVSAGNILHAAVTSSKYTGSSTYTPLYSFLNSVMGDTDSAYCPVIDIKDNAYSDGKEVLLAGTAVFGKDGSTITLSPEMTLGLNLIKEDVENADLTVSTDEGKATLEIIDAKSDISVDTTDKKAEFSINLRLRCDIPEYQSEHFKGLSKSDTEDIAKRAAEKITVILSEFLNETLYKNNYDVVSLGRYINLNDHGLYSEILSEDIPLRDICSFHIETTVEIRRIGKIILDKE